MSTMVFRYFDAHTHVQFPAFDADRDAVMARALDAGVGMIAVGTQRDTSRRAVECARANANVWATVGLHPVHTAKSFHDAQELGGGEAAKAFTSRGEEFDYEYYKALAADSRVVAIGECGLDFFRVSDDDEKKKQTNALLLQMELARDVGKPLMIHCRAALPDLIQLLVANYRLLITDNPGVMHFFAGTVDEARKLLDLGFSFTFGGVVTYPKKPGKPIYDDVIRFLPADRILVETDAPYVAPVPYRGKRNEPAYVIEVVKKLAEVRAAPLEEFSEQLRANVSRVFKI